MNKSKITIQKIGLMLIALILMLSVCSCGGQKNLIGTWVATDADNQKLEIRTEELRFNYRTFDYTVGSNAMHLSETFPNHSISGDLKYKFDGDLLVIDLGTEFSGYFYGRSGTVKLKRLQNN